MPSCSQLLVQPMQLCTKLQVFASSLHLSIIIITITTHIMLKQCYLTQSHDSVESDPLWYQLLWVLIKALFFAACNHQFIITVNTPLLLVIGVVEIIMNLVTNMLITNMIITN